MKTNLKSFCNNQQHFMKKKTKFFAAAVLIIKRILTFLKVWKIRNSYYSPQTLKINDASMIKIKLFFSVFSLRQYLYDARKDPRANVKVEFVPKENENKCSDTNIFRLTWLSQSKIQGQNSINGKKIEFFHCVLRSCFISRYQFFLKFR